MHPDIFHTFSLGALMLQHSDVVAQTGNSVRLQDYLWMAGLIAHVLLLLVLLVRGRVMRLPLFTLLIVFYIARTGVPQMAFTHSLPMRTYINLFWGFEIGDVVLRALVLAEVMRHAFQGTRVQLGRLAAWSVVAVVLSIALSVVTGPTQRMLLWSIFSKGNVAVAILSLFVIVALVATRRATGLSLRSHEIAISGGLAFYALTFLVLQGIRMWGAGQANPHGGEHMAFFHYWMQASAAVTYLGVVVYWAVSLWFDDPPRAVGVEG
jgi:hypothetical protein